jgi:xylulokinase
MSFVLLDIGGTFIKCRLSDQSVEFKTEIPAFIQNQNQNIKEINPLELIEGIESVITKFIQSDQDIEGIIVTGQMHGWIITNDNYEPIHNLVSWQDSRSLENGYYESFLNNIDKSDILVCGNEIKPGSPVVGISMTMKDFNKENFKILSLLSWVTSQLVDHYSNTLHITDAAAFSFYSLSSNEWNKNIRDLAMIPPESLPKVDKKMSVIGLSKIGKIPVFTPIGDFQASIVGAKLEQGEISFNIATGGQVSYLDRGLANENMQTRPYLNDLFIHTRTHLPAGRHASYILSKFRKGELKQNWDHLNNKCIDIMEKVLDNFQFDLDINGLFKNDSLDFFDSNEKLVEYIASILKNYTDILDQVPTDLKFNVIGSGGLIANSSFVRECLEYLGKFQFKRITLRSDASINGLEILSKELSIFN